MSSGSMFMNYGKGLQIVLREISGVGQNCDGLRTFSFVITLYRGKNSTNRLLMIFYLSLCSCSDEEGAFRLT